MLIVQGTFRLDPAERDAFLAQSLETMRNSRNEHGCLEYVMAADPVEPDRVVLSERWESREDLDAHIRGLTQLRAEAATRGDAPGINASRDVTVYEIASSKPMG